MKVLKNIFWLAIGGTAAFAICLRSQHILEARLGSIENRLAELSEVHEAPVQNCPAVPDAKALAFEISRTIKVSCPDIQAAALGKESTGSIGPMQSNVMATMAYQRGREVVEAMHSSHQWSFDRMSALMKELALLDQDKRNELSQEVVDALSSGDVVSDIPGPFF